MKFNFSIVIGTLEKIRYHYSRLELDNWYWKVSTIKVEDYRL